MKNIMILVLIAVLLLYSCGKKEKEKVSETAINQYASDSVMDEVKKKTIENPNDAEAMYHLAELYERGGQYQEAIDSYKKAVGIKPDMGYAYFKIGTDYDRLEKPDEALKAFNKAQKYLPNYPALYNNRAMAYGRLGNTAAQIEDLKKALRLRPSYTAARSNLALAYLNSGRKKEAMKQYEELEKSDKTAADNLLKEIEKAK